MIKENKENPYRKFYLIFFRMNHMQGGIDKKPLHTHKKSLIVNENKILSDNNVCQE